MSNKLQTYFKVISLSGLMAFVILTSCNVRKGIQQLVGQEIQKQLIPSKTIQNQTEVCISAFDEVEAEVHKNATTSFNFNASLLFSTPFIKTEVENTIISFAQTTQAIHKVGLYLLYKQLKTHH